MLHTQNVHLTKSTRTPRSYVAKLMISRSNYISCSHIQYVCTCSPVPNEATKYKVCTFAVTPHPSSPSFNVARGIPERHLPTCSQSHHQAYPPLLDALSRGQLSIKRGYRKSSVQDQNERVCWKYRGEAYISKDELLCMLRQGKIKLEVF